MWDWIRFSFKVYLAYQTAVVVTWLMLALVVFVATGLAWLILQLLEGLSGG